MFQKTFVDNAVQLIRDRNYAAGFKLMAKKSKLAKRILVSTVVSMVKQEVKSLSPTTFSQSLTPDAVTNFNWTTIIPEIQTGFPVLFSIVKAGIQTKKTHVEV